MLSFDPTLAPPGRLTRLGVVLDGSSPASRLAALTRMCERAGIDAVWIADAVGPDVDALVTAGQIGADLGRAHLGLMVDPRRRTPQQLAIGLSRLAQSSPAPVEVAIQESEPSGADYAEALRVELAAGPLPRPRLSAAAGTGEMVRRLLATVDDVVLPSWHHIDLETAADEARAAAADGGRDPASLGVAALVPVSIGRTGAEASARADLDPLFAALGHPAEIGIFGTLEECQDRVIALAHAGISDLRCLLPSAPDVHDVIAQLTAITVGTTDVLRPGALRSPSPPPPEGWGGRFPQPTRASVSDGSRRR
jgi:alkanesulfonate monooxygenase SsuD/methylene tetrahydromethanopterin reductase-like flavin-dependent oxidoreductase (luciferase family)